jgi:hypothetical protein
VEDTPIDIIFLVERLESLIANGKKLPLTTNVATRTRHSVLSTSCASPAPEESAPPSASTRGEGSSRRHRRKPSGSSPSRAGGLPHGELHPVGGAPEPRIADAHRDADDIRRGADEYAVSVLAGRGTGEDAPD